MTILITTSRRTNQRTRRLAKELSWVIPFSIKINRGHMSLDDLRRLMYVKGFSKLIIITSRRGNPYIINFLYPSLKKFEYFLTLEIVGLKLQVDSKTHTILNEMQLRYIGGDKRIFEKLKTFIGEYLYDPLRKNGIKGYLSIREGEGHTILQFENMDGEPIYPLLKVVLMINEL